MAGSLDAYGFNEITTPVLIKFVEDNLFDQRISI